MPKKVLVCQNTTCQQQGSDQLLAAFEQCVPAEKDGITVEPSGCLGQCGSGPMVLVTVEKIWYSKVQIKDVPVIVKQHLIGNRPVTRKLYPKMHEQQQNFIWIWLFGIAAFLALCIGVAIAIGGHYVPV